MGNFLVAIIANVYRTAFVLLSLVLAEIPGGAVAAEVSSAERRTAEELDKVRTNPLQPAPSARFPGGNAAFAAKYIPGAELHVIPGPDDHEIFVNECDDEGRDEFPEACIDAPGVDRAAIHQTVGNAAVQFFDTSLQK
jgi:hypothetical protein